MQRIELLIAVARSVFRALDSICIWAFLIFFVVISLASESGLGLLLLLTLSALELFVLEQVSEQA